MGKPGAKKMDQIVSVTPGDVHIIMIPSPGGPVPTPIPHPCASIIKDKVATKVKVMGQPGAVKGSKSKHTPPHIPMGPGPFQKPPKNEGEIITGSANVFYEGKEAAMLGDTGQMCSDPSDTPVGKVVGTAATVLIGGGGGGSDEAREKASADAMKAAAAACHKWINANMPPGADREQAHRDVCTATGHPVDVATGKMFTRSVDLRLRGRIPFEFVRNYSSARPDLGPFGRGWRHSIEAQLFVHSDFVALRDANGRWLPFKPVHVGQVSRNELSRSVLSRTSNGYSVAAPDGSRQSFILADAGSFQGATVIPLGVTEDRFGNAIHYGYRRGVLAQLTDTAGRRVEVDYNDRGLISTLRLSENESLPAFVVRSYEYEHDLLVAVRDESGAAATYEYSEHLLVRETDRTGSSFYFSYDKDGWCRETWGDGGLLRRRLNYDRAKRRTLVTDSLGYTTSYIWNESGVVVEEKDPAGHSWTFQYNDSLQQVMVHDPMGHAWSYEYDATGQLLAGEDPEGGAFSYEYDDAGRMKKYVDRAGAEWHRDYSESSGGTRLRGPLGYTTIEVRNQRGDISAAYDHNGLATHFGFDARGNLTHVNYPSGLRLSRTHSLSGDLLTESDQFGLRVKIEYDQRRRIQAVWTRDRGKMAYEYDAESRVMAVVNDHDARTEYEWGSFDRLKRVVLPAIMISDGRTVRPIKEFEYDSENRLTAVRLPGNEIVRYEYAGHLHRASRISYPDGRVQEFQRNARGFVTGMRENGHLVYTQDVDSAGRVVRRTTGDGEAQEFEYDAFGRLVRAVDDGHACEVVRDALGRITEESTDEGAIAYQHEEGSIFRRINIDGTPLFAMAAGELPGAIDLQVQGRPIAQLRYDALDRLTDVACSGGAHHQIRYENSRLPASWTVVGTSGALIRQDSYQYDEAGRLVATVGDHEHRRTFTRDPIGRLVEERSNDGAGTVSTRWRYDERGNRTSEERNAPGRQERCDLQYLSGNRLVLAGGIGLSHDDRGRVILRRNPDGELTHFTWDALNRMRTATCPDGSTYRMSYDALGRRTSVEGPEGVKRFLWSGNRLVEEIQPDGTRRHFFYEAETFRPLLSITRLPDAEEWEVTSFVTDPRGCPEAQIGANDSVVWQAEVTPWGGRRNEESFGIPQPLGLPGQYVEGIPGLAYNFARFYMPEVGAYLTPDPAGLGGGDRAYAYLDDPVCWIDPLGLSGDDYVPHPNPLVEACGPVQPPFETRRGELANQTPIQVAMPGHPIVLNDPNAAPTRDNPNPTDRYLYVVGPNGEIYYAQQSRQGMGETVKHTTLAGPDPANPSEARPMRTGGEINYDHDRGVWVMDGSSGRYSSDSRRATRTPDNVAAVSALNNSFGPGGTPIETSPEVFPRR